jgi:hypothetical protein
MNPGRCCIVVLLCAMIPHVLGASGSCEVTCDGSDLCLGTSSGDDIPVCLREMESKLKAVLGMVDELLQELNSTRDEFNAFKVQQSVWVFIMIYSQALPG